MSSLIFRALDQQVIAGHADKPAIDDGTVSLTYAQLLAQTAALAGGLAQVGVEDGTHVAIDVHGAAEVGAVLACARLGAIPDAKAKFRIAGDPPVVHTGEHEYTWATVISAGKTDPMPSPDRDGKGYAELMMDEYEGIFATLTAGNTIT
ncbi:MAG: AMP-binding protein [Actinomycetota bacterium]|nr:AMP-binding protein [Actinomycetota bacterium]